jgi:hypothetical protein
MLCFQRSRFIENYPIMILGDEVLLSQGGVLSQRATVIEISLVLSHHPHWKGPILHQQEVLQLHRERSPPRQYPLTLTCLGNPTLAKISKTMLEDESIM